MSCSSPSSVSMTRSSGWAGGGVRGGMTPAACWRRHTAASTGVTSSGSLLTPGSDWAARHESWCGRPHGASQNSAPASGHCTACWSASTTGACSNVDLRWSGATVRCYPRPAQPRRAWRLTLSSRTAMWERTWRVPGSQVHQRSEVLQAGKPARTKNREAFSKERI